MRICEQKENILAHKLNTVDLILTTIHKLKCMDPGSGQVRIPKIIALPAVTRQRSETTTVRLCIFQPFRYMQKTHVRHGFQSTGRDCKTDLPLPFTTAIFWFCSYLLYMTHKNIVNSKTLIWSKPTGC